MAHGSHNKTPQDTALLTVPGWVRLLPGLVHGFSAGLPREDESAPERQARALVERVLGSPAPAPVLMSQPHGRDLADLGNGHAPRNGNGAVIPGVDGVHSTLRAGHVLFVKSADCVPVLAVHPERGAYAALHAGWRGVAAGILPNLLESWRRAGFDPRGVMLALGPHIRACCFEVREDCIARFAPEDLEGALQRKQGQAVISLEATLRAQAGRHGVPPENITTLPLCTTCHQERTGEHLFASHRRALANGAPGAGRNLSFIGTRTQRRG